MYTTFWLATKRRVARRGRMPRPKMKASLSMTDYLDAPADPVMLAAESFVKFKPWRRDVAALWLTCSPGVRTQSIEVLQLKSIVFNAIRKDMKEELVAWDPFIHDVLTMLASITCQTEGFEACRAINKMFVCLAALQIERLGAAVCAAEQFPEAVAPDVFRTVLLRNVAGTAVSPCENMIKMNRELMRLTTFEHIKLMGLKSADKKRFDVVDSLDGKLWFEQNWARLSAISQMASTVD